MIELKTQEGLLENALELVNALKGLYTFTNLRMNTTNVTIEDISALNGLVFAILAQATINAFEVDKFVEATRK